MSIIVVRYKNLKYLCSMIKKIIHIADLHIPNSESDRPYTEMIKGFVKQLAEVVVNANPSECRIVVAGDTFHNKISVSNEATVLYAKVLNSFNALCKTYILAGNHDMLENNLSRTDSLVTPFYIRDALPNVTYIDHILDYQSGCVVDDDVIWACYSMHNGFARPDIDAVKQRNPNCKVVGLYHGNLVGASTDSGKVCESGASYNDFNGCDCVMAGHIHRYQEIRKNGIPFVYAGSVFQQDYGENASGHGFVVWDLETMKHQLVEVDNPYKMYKFAITDYDDVKNDVEKILNL